MTAPLGPLDDLVALEQLTALAAVTSPALRDLHPHERRAGIRFADAAASMHAIASQRLARLVADRGRFLELVATYARGVLAQHPHATGADARLLMLALSDTRHPLILLPGVRELVNAAGAFHLAALRDAAALGAVHVRAEARHQGLALRPPLASLAGPDDPAYRPVAAGQPPTDPTLDAELATRAAAAADNPLVDVGTILRNYALTLPATSWSYGSFIDHVLAAGAAASTRGLETDVAAAPVQQAWGLGRQAEAAAIAGQAGEPGSVYASELLDGHTCPPCFRIDGTAYDSRAAGDADYPGGIYAYCRGGPRCRGTLVYVWASEQPATMP